MEQLWESLPWDYLRIHTPALLFRCGIGVVVFALFWLAARIAQRITVRLSHRPALNADLVSFLAGSVRIALLTLGVVTALGTMGIDVTALVASVGLVGFALGFALKDMIGNALAGILILVYKPFQRNDLITVDPHTGVVVEINLRYTVLSTEDSRILIPNANMFTNAIKVANRKEPGPLGPITAPPLPAPSSSAEIASGP